MYDTPIPAQISSPAFERYEGFYPKEITLAAITIALVGEEENEEEEDDETRKIQQTN